MFKDKDAISIGSLYFLVNIKNNIILNIIEYTTHDICIRTKDVKLRNDFDTVFEMFHVLFYQCTMFLFCINAFELST